MSGKVQKCVGGAITGDQSKKCKTVITLEQKLDVFKSYENTEKTCDTVHVTGLNEAMLHTICTNATELEQVLLVLLL
jgi:hypothetical protein